MYYTWTTGQAKFKIFYKWSIFEIGTLANSQSRANRDTVNRERVNAWTLIVFVCPMFNFTHPPQRTTVQRQQISSVRIAWSWAHEWICDCLCQSIPVLWEPCWMAQIQVFFVVLLSFFPVDYRFVAWWHGPEPRSVRSMSDMVLSPWVICDCLCQSIPVLWEPCWMAQILGCFFIVLLFFFLWLSSLIIF